MRIGTCTSKTESVQHGFIRVSYSKHSTKIPITIIEGKEPGNTALISSGIHGDELNGIQIVSKFSNSINPSKLKGTLVIAPTINPIGFFYGERRVHYDQKDLNRCFGLGVKSFSHKLANVFFDEVISNCDFGLDFHDSTKKNILLPHTRIFKKDYKDIEELSKVFGTEIVMKRSPKRGMLALEAIQKKKIPILTIEIGGGMTVLPNYVNIGLQGINNVLVHKGFLEGEVKVPKKQFILDDRIGYRSKIRGILNIKKSLGSLVDKDQLVGEVFNPINRKQIELRARDPGVLFSVKALSSVKANQKAFSILHLKRKGDTIVPTNATVILNRNKSGQVTTKTGVFNKSIDSLMKHSKSFFSDLLNE